MGLWQYDLVRNIARSALKAFLNRSPAYADAREPLMAWYRQIKAADWATPAAVKRDIRSASILKDGRVVFNLAGNKYRIVVWINYPYRVVFPRTGASARSLVHSSDSHTRVHQGISKRIDLSDLIH